MKSCRVCQKEFVGMNSMAVVCSLACAKRVPVIARATLKAKAKAERVATKEAKLKLKTRAQWMAEAQAVFNQFIRKRDEGKPCICCGRYSVGGSVGGDMDAGHYRSRGAAGHLRFDERNVHAQLKHCNRYAFDSAAYRAGLLARIGAAAVEELENDTGPRRFTVDDLKAIKATYRQKLKELEKA